MKRRVNNIAKAFGVAATAAGLLLLVCETPGLGLAGFAGVKAAGALLAALGSRIIVKADPAVEGEEV